VSLKAKAPHERLDANHKVRAAFRTPYVTGMVNRARSAGLPEECLDWSGGDSAWYTECLYRVTEIRNRPSSSFASEHERAQLLEDLAEVMKLGLSDHGIRENEETGRLVPRAAELHFLIARSRDHEAGRKTRRRKAAK
jgi:hypothetical protein